MWHQLEDLRGHPVQVAQSAIPVAERVDRTVRLPRVEDLIIMKVIAHRDKDMQDVDGLLDAYPEVNLDEIRQQVSEFAAATSMSDLLDDFERLLRRRKSKQPATRPRPK